MRVSEIFPSCQGEGTHTGIPMLFIRLYGCNMHCTYCDTLYAIEGSKFKELSIEEIVKQVKVPLEWVALTGGEPLIHQDLRDLVERLEVPTEIWTNGTIRPPSWMREVGSWVVDVKCPSSGIKQSLVHRNLLTSWEWWIRLRSCDTLKFTVADEHDLDFVTEYLSPSVSNCNIVISPIATLTEPIWTKDWLQRVWNYCTENNYRFSLQIHKIVWSNKHGV